MKFSIYSDPPGIELEDEIEWDEDSDIARCIEAHFGDELYEALRGAHNPVLQRGRGFFWNTDEIESELYSYAKAYLDRHYGGKFFVKVVDDDGTVVSDEELDLWGKVIAYRRDYEQSHVDVGAAIIVMLENFLRGGVWQFGLRRKDGTILTDPSQWPELSSSADRVIWQDRSGPLEPMIWFGLQDEPPIECWTLDRSTAQSQRSLYYPSPYATEARPVERWHNFWFCSFWTLDWNGLFGDQGNPYITWMFAECGMDEPVDEFHAVRSSCPIELDEQDTSEELFRKIEDLFVKTQRGLR